MATYPLLFLPSQPEVRRCKGDQHPVPVKIPNRNPHEHGAHLEKLFDAAWKANSESLEQRVAIALPAKDGIYLGVKGAMGHALATKSLDNSRGDYRLLNVRHEGEGEACTIIATVYIPDRGRGKFAQKIQQYATELTPNGKPKNAQLMQGIEEMYLAVSDDFWTDDPAAMPQELPQWCEIWLQNTVSGDAFGRFAAQADALGIEYNKKACLSFPERTVTLAKINKEMFHRLLLLSPDIAEYRLAREPAEFFADMSPREQVDWVTEFLKHSEFTPSPQLSVCVLDTGVNRGHPLLAPALQETDMHAFAPEWGTHDHFGHGTGMAGIALYGDLVETLANPRKCRIEHCLESCKIRPRQNDLPPELYGLVTTMAVQQAKDVAPQRTRQVCMAVSAPSPFAHRGEPTSWSAAIDALAAGVDGDTKHLVIISAGNIPKDEYPIILTLT